MTPTTMLSLLSSSVAVLEEAVLKLVPVVRERGSAFEIAKIIFFAKWVEIGRSKYGKGRKTDGSYSPALFQRPDEWKGKKAAATFDELCKEVRQWDGCGDFDKKFTQRDQALLLVGSYVDVLVQWASQKSKKLDNPVAVETPAAPEVTAEDLSALTDDGEPNF